MSTKKITSIVMAIIMMISVLHGVDVHAEYRLFSECKLIVKTEDTGLIEKDKEIKSANETHILEYNSAAETKEAYEKLKNTSAKVEIDKNAFYINANSSEESNEDKDKNKDLSEVEKILLEKDDNEYDIALIDTGVSDVNIARHLSVIEDSHGEDDNGHGSEMARAMLGENKDLKILSIKALGKDGKGNLSDICMAIEIAMEKNVKVINMSFSGKMADSEILQQAILKAKAKGIEVVASAGNNNEEVDGYIPASLDRVTTIGSINEDKTKAGFSNYGEKVDYYAQGESTSVSAAKYSSWFVTNSINEKLAEGVLVEKYEEEKTSSASGDAKQDEHQEYIEPTYPEETEDTSSASGDAKLSTNGTFNLSDWTYTTSGNTYILTKYTGTDVNVIIPGYYGGRRISVFQGLFYNESSKPANNKIETVVFQEANGYNVLLNTSMNHMFYSCNQLKTVDLSGLGSINKTDLGSTFYYCSTLTEIKGLNNIHAVNALTNTFYKCSKLQTIDFSGLTSQGTGDVNMECTFERCEALTEIKGLNNIHAVSTLRATFNECYKLQTIDFSGLTSQGTDALDTWGTFQDCNALTEIKGLHNIHALEYGLDYTFYKCYNLQAIDLSGLTSQGTDAIGMEWAFNYCEKLTEIKGLNNIHAVNALTNTFYKCSKLQTIDFSGLTSQGTDAIDTSSTFEGCSALTEIRGLNNIHAVSNLLNTFQECSKLQTIDLSGLTSQGTDTTPMCYTFYQCSALTEIKGLNNIHAVDTWNGLRYVFAQCSKLQAIDLSGLTSQGTNAISMCYAFDGCSALTEIKGLGNIHAVSTLSYAFNKCSNLQTIDLSGLTSQGTGWVDVMYAFNECSALTEIKGLNNIHDIGALTYTFNKCSKLQTVDFSGLTNLGTYAVNMEYAFSECSALTEIKGLGNIHAVSKLTYTFNKCPKLQTIDFSGLTSQGTDAINMGLAFNECKVLIEIKGLENIHAVSNLNATFADCSKLQIVDFSGLTSQGTNAINMGWTFGNCSALTEIKGLNNIHAVSSLYVTFQSCFNLQAVDFSGLTSQGTNAINMSYAFTNCFALTEIKGLNNIHAVSTLKNAFNQCSKLQTIDLSGLTSQGANAIDMLQAFNQCSALTDISGLENIHAVSNLYCAFQVCSKLQTVDFSGLTSQGTDAVDMGFAFNKCSVLTEIKGLNNIHAVSTLYATFQRCSNLQTVDFSGLTSQGIDAINMESTFLECSALTEINGLENIHAVSTLKWTFYNCLKLQIIDLSGLTSQGTDVVSMYRTFDFCHALTEIKGLNNIHAVSTLRATFNECYKLQTIDFSGLTSQGTDAVDMGFAFNKCSVLTEIKGLNNIHAVSTLYATFAECSKLQTIDLSGLTNQGTDAIDMGWAFDKCFALTEIKGLNNIHVVSSLSAAFANCPKLQTIDLSGLTSQGTDAIDMRWTFEKCFTLTEIKGLNNIHAVSTLCTTFANCPKLQTIDLSGLTSQGTDAIDMEATFSGCSALTDIYGLESIHAVSTLNNTFNECSALEHLWVNSFDTSNVTNFEKCFYNCASIKYLNVSNWDISKANDNSKTMFSEMNSLSFLKTPKAAQKGKIELPYVLMQEDEEKSIFEAIGKTISHKTDMPSTLAEIFYGGNLFDLAKEINDEEIEQYLKEAEQDIANATSQTKKEELEDSLSLLKAVQKIKTVDGSIAHAKYHTIPETSKDLLVSNWQLSLVPKAESICSSQELPKTYSLVGKVTEPIHIGTKAELTEQLGLNPEDYEICAQYKEGKDGTKTLSYDLTEFLNKDVAFNLNESDWTEEGDTNATIKNFFVATPLKWNINILSEDKSSEIASYKVPLNTSKTITKEVVETELEGKIEHGDKITGFDVLDKNGNVESSIDVDGNVAYEKDEVTDTTLNATDREIKELTNPTKKTLVPKTRKRMFTVSIPKEIKGKVDAKDTAVNYQVSAKGELSPWCSLRIKPVNTRIDFVGDVENTVGVINQEETLWKLEDNCVDSFKSVLGNITYSMGRNSRMTGTMEFFVEAVVN